MAGGFNLPIPTPTTAPGPAEHGKAITPNDSANLSAATRYIYVGGAGDITLILNGDAASAILLKAVPAGMMLEVSASAVKATGTTATEMVALW